jgi:Zn finger protein HypA/HybF involved in hydrogenase expression
MTKTATRAIKHNPKNVTTYLAKSGKTMYRPSIEYGMALMHDDCGFCLACGNDQQGVEPDARQYACDHCGESKVYGIEELALKGLLF